MKEELGINLETFKFFKDYHKKYKEIDMDLHRWVFLAPIPDINKLKINEGEISLIGINQVSNLKMVPDDIEIIQEIKDKQNF
jgi:hypothetical protein